MPWARWQAEITRAWGDPQPALRAGTIVHVAIDRGHSAATKNDAQQCDPEMHPPEGDASGTSWMKGALGLDSHGPGASRGNDGGECPDVNRCRLVARTPGDTRVRGARLAAPAHSALHAPHQRQGRNAWTGRSLLRSRGRRQLRRAVRPRAWSGARPRRGPSGRASAPVVREPPLWRPDGSLVSGPGEEPEPAQPLFGLATPLLVSTTSRARVGMIRAQHDGARTT